MRVGEQCSISNRMNAMLTNGRNMIETISSSFSVMVMASPPSRGTINPAMNAPFNSFSKPWNKARLHTKNCMDTDNVSKKCGTKNDHHRDGHENYRWSAFN